MRHLLTLLLSAASIVAATAQVETIATTDFRKVDVFGPFRIELVKAETPSVKIDYHGFEKDAIVVKSKNRDLSIRFKNREYLDFEEGPLKRSRVRFTNVTIYYTQLDVIEVRAGARVESSAPLAAQKLLLVSKMGSKITLDVKASEIVLTSSMGSEVDLSGTAEKLKIRSKMGSDVNASFLKCQRVRVNSSMGSEVSVHAQDELVASADFGSTIKYNGNPASKKMSRFLGAEIRGH